MKKIILDACCGGRLFWFDKNNPHVLFADNRIMPPTVVGHGKHSRTRACLPDKVTDFRDMDIDDNTFKLVVFDPPHLFVGEKSHMAQTYGRLNKETWKDDIKRGFRECFRVLKNEGILIFKWNECDVPIVVGCKKLWFGNLRLPVRRCCETITESNRVEG